MTAQDTKVTQEDDTDGEGAKAPFALKLLVGALAVAIVVMLLLIILKIAKGDHKKAPAVQTAVPVTENPVSGALKNLKIERPEGSELISASTSASGDILLHFRGQQGDVLVRVTATGLQQHIVIE